LNYATLTDLAYHVRLIQYLIDTPTLGESLSEVRINQEHALEERKDSNSPLRRPETSTDEDKLHESFASVRHN